MFYSVKISEDGIQALLELSGGDMRKVLNTLQSTWLSARDVTEDTVYTCVGHPLRADIDTVLTRLLNEDDFGVCFKCILFRTSLHSRLLRPLSVLLCFKLIRGPLVSAQSV